MNITDEQLIEWQRLCDEARTPAPWHTNGDGHVYGPQNSPTTVAARIYTTFARGDGELIAAAREAMPALIAEVNWLRSERMDYEAMLAYHARPEPE
jgi:hypothetical protein